jgi:DNA replication and checkpoint protein
MATEYASLRAELKQWEKVFHAEHGRKATPDDIRLVYGLGGRLAHSQSLIVI